MKNEENDWYQRNVWWILTIVLIFLAVIFINAAILVHPGLLIGLFAVAFGFYVVSEMRKLQLRSQKKHPN